MYDFETERKARMVLEALQALDERRTRHRDAAAANGDEDAAADYGNDMSRLRSCAKALKRRPLKLSVPMLGNCSGAPDVAGNVRTVNTRDRVRKHLRPLDP